ncbi:hypothetical protein CRENBAI_022107 [Crenichthys baileyi]|uniref:Uncharacterized protein n=1 Tax=Crenichthys baileyi TaxID=28760 RepID=A0AAV9SNP3_9TELE
MIPPTTDPADKRKADALDRWVERLKEEAMRNLPTDLEVLPLHCCWNRWSVRQPSAREFGSAALSLRLSSDVPLLLPYRQLSRHLPPVAGIADVQGLTAGRLAKRWFLCQLTKVSQACLSSARCSDATPEELEERLRFFARQIKSFRRTCLMYSSPELMERIWQMERDYETAVRQFYCGPPSTPVLQGAAAAAEQPTPGLQGAAAAAEQPTPGLQGAAAAAEQPTPGLQGAAAAAEQPTPGLQGAAAAAAAEQPTAGLQGAAAAAEQPTPGLQGAAAAAEQPTPGLQGAAAAAAAEQPTPGLHPAVLSTFSVFSGGVLVELKSDTPQPVSARSDTPQPVPARPDPPQPVPARPDPPQPVPARPDPKSASTSSIRRRGRRKRDASAHATGGLCDASALAHVTEGPTDASAPSLQGFSGKLVLVLASAPLDEGFEEEAPPDPVSGDFKEQFVLVLASESRDEGLPGAASASEGSPGAASASEGSPGATSASEGSPGAVSASEGSPGTASASEGSPGAASASEGLPGSASEGSPGIPGRPPELCACSGRPPGRPPDLCACSGRPPGRPPELCACFWPSCRGPLCPPCVGCFLDSCGRLVSALKGGVLL